MSERSQELFLFDIIESIDAIQSFVSDNTPKSRSAVAVGK
jgi:uncharacterized protein with HEPN domain